MLLKLDSNLIIVIIIVDSHPRLFGTAKAGISQTLPAHLLNRGWYLYPEGQAGSLTLALSD